MFKQRALAGDFSSPDYDDGYKPDPEEEKQRQIWSAYLLMAFGGFIFVRSTFEYLRIRRMKSLIEASSSIITSL